MERRSGAARFWAADPVEPVTKQQGQPEELWASPAPEELPPISQQIQPMTACFALGELGGEGSGSPMEGRLLLLALPGQCSSISSRNL